MLQSTTRSGRDQQVRRSPSARLIARGLLALGVASLVAACSGGGDSSTSESSGPQSPTTENATPDVTAPPGTEAAGSDPTTSPGVGQTPSLIASTPVAEHRFSEQAVSSVSAASGGPAGLWIGAALADGDGLLIEIDPTSGAILRELPIDRPVRLSSGARHVWADSGDAAIRVDVATGEITDIEGDLPSAWGEQVWIDQDTEGVRLDPDTLEVIARATITGADVLPVLPDADILPTAEFPLSLIFAGPEEAWTLEAGLGAVRLNADTGAVTDVISLLDWALAGESAAVVDGGIWFLAENIDDDDDVTHLLKATPEGGVVHDVVLPPEADVFATVAGDDTFIYVLPTEGPLYVVDAVGGELLATIVHESFVDNAEGVALAGGAVWVTAPRNELLLEFRP